MAAIVLLLLSACAEPPEPARAVQLRGTVTIHPETAGSAYERVYHAWTLQGELRHPLRFITEFSVSPDGSFEETIDYPVDRGEGLVIYAWLDTDVDEVLCTPTERDDLAGLVVADYPADEVSVSFLLTDQCRGPEWFFPAK
jgi:hypothetical protein